MMFKLNKHALLILAVLLILLIPCSFASEITNETVSVDDSTDTAITAGDDMIYVYDEEVNGDGSQDNPYNSISDAVEKFNASTNSNIFIKNGDYDISKTINIDKDITIIGESKDGTVLKADSKDSIFKISTSSKVILINLTIKNSNSKDGAINIDASDAILDVNNCVFENNTVGGAIKYYYMWSKKNATVTISNSNFINNKNKDNGGAISLSGGNLLNVTKSIFENNEAENNGGAIYTYTNIKNVYVSSSEFINNRALKGSAIGQYCGGDLYVSYCNFVNNTSPGTDANGTDSSVIFDEQVNNNELTLYINKNTFTNNKLTDDVINKGNVKVLYLDRNTKITANDVDKIYGDDFNYIVTLTDDNDDPISGKEIIATLTNKNTNEVTIIRNTTGANGKAIISSKNQKAGKYSVSAVFEGDDTYDTINTNNIISIRTENEYNIVFEPDYAHISEGDSYIVTGYIYDYYLVPVNLVSSTFSVDWINHAQKHLIVEGGSYKVTEGYKIEFDVNRCHLVTRDEPYTLYFNISNIGSAPFTVDLSKDLSNIDESLDIIYVSKSGNDETGDGSENNPLETVQTALIANAKFNGGKTIIVKEGTYDISTFTIVGNVTIIGEKGKTIFRQHTGRLGMFEIEDKNTVNLINITFIDGYATPIPESLLHITEESTAYITGCEFYNNTAYFGGAIAVSRGGTVYIKDSYFHDNHGFLNTNGAGVMYVERGYAYIENSTFENNTASEGGVLYLGFESEADIVNSTFIRNSAIETTHSEGGGGAIFTRSNNLNIENCSFIENHADLYGGAIYLDYGDINITKSYFENNHVNYNGDPKGSAIESFFNYCNITMNYCVLIAEENYPGNYLVLINAVDEINHTVDLRYNYWKNNASKATPGSDDEVIITISSENEYIYTGDIVEFTIEFINSNKENGTSPLEGFVHDYDLFLIPKLGEIEDPLVTIKDNKATFVYTATTVGTETIQMGNILLDKTFRFTVQDGSNKADLNPTIDIIAGKNSEIIVSLDEDINGNITIRVNDEDYSVAVENSKATLTLETLPGDYEVKAIYQGAESYKGFVISKTFNIPRFDSVVKVEDTTTYYSGDLKATLLDAEGKPIKNESLTISINNTEYTVKTDSNGIATLNLNLPRTGVYNVVTKFKGNSNYNPSEANSILTIEFANINIKAEENVVVTPIEGSFSFTVTDNEGNEIKNIEIKVTLNDKEYAIKTNDEGIATLDLTNNLLDVKTYDITAKIDETKVFNEASVDSKLTVIKEKATLNSNDISVFANKGEVKVTLVDKDKNPLSNKTISINIDNKINEVTTDENGVATLKLNLESGKYQATIKLAEDPVYSAKDIEININVKETATTISVENMTVYYSNGKYSARLVDVNGNPIEDSRLIIHINGNDLLAMTDDNGVGSVNINNLAVGTYKVTVKFEGNDIFQASDATSTVNVLSSIISQDMTRGYNSPYDFQATLLDSQGNALKNIALNVTVNGKQYSVNTDSQGVMTLKEKFAIGNYAITLVNPETNERVSNYAKIVSRFSGNKNLAMDYYDGSTYKVRIVGNDGKYVGAGESVKMKVNGKTYTVKTTSKGYASLKINLVPKKYTITTTYKGQTIKNTITVKQVIKVTKTTNVKKSAKKLTLKATLKNSKNKAIKNKKVTFKFKGKKYTAKTNSKGVVKVTVKKSVISKLKKGKKYTVTVTYVKDKVKCYVKVK